MSKTVEVCLTPELISQHELAGKVAVVVDIFRATSCMITGLSEGATAIYPVSTVEACLDHGRNGMLTAGERGGIKIPEFDLGNSPFHYMNGAVTDRNVAVTTTNGTLAIEKSKGADEIIIGAFLNLTRTAKYLKTAGKSVLIHCAGWKGTPNLEDTLYAGALANALLADDYQLEGDSVKLAVDYFRMNKSDLLHAAKQSGHAHRLAGFGVTEDAAFCLDVDRIDQFVGILKGDRILRV